MNRYWTVDRLAKCGFPPPWYLSSMWSSGWGHPAHPCVLRICEVGLVHIVAGCRFRVVDSLTPRLDTACFSSWLVWCYQTSPGGILERFSDSCHSCRMGVLEIQMWLFFCGTAPSVNLVVWLVEKDLRICCPGCSHRVLSSRWFGHFIVVCGTLYNFLLEFWGVWVCLDQDFPPDLSTLFFFSLIKWHATLLRSSRKKNCFLFLVLQAQYSQFHLPIITTN